MGEELVLLDCLNSAFAMRVKIALEEKGVNYVCKEQNLVQKESLLLEMNPVHKLVPVLIHNGKPVCESLVILEYIDEVWTGSSSLLLPIDPYQRSKARFWGDFIDNKIFAVLKQLWTVKREEHEKIIMEFIENLKTLEEVIQNEKFFGGDTFDYVDVALIPITCWFPFLESIGKFRIEHSCPKIVTWAKRCKERQSVSNSLPNPDKFYSFVLVIKKALGLD